MPPRRVYWDSCTFLGMLNEEPTKANDCRAIWNEAKNGDTIILTSFLTFAEVFKAKCETEVATKPLPEEDEKAIVNLLQQPWIVPAVVDERIAVSARTLLRRHPECKKAPDGIHLATALALNVDEMHTFDGSDLLHLSGKTQRQDGAFLTICKPTPIPPPAPPPPPAQRPIWEASDE